ncbi:MAG: hypothetical protein V4696_11295 [Pseudomonadota bacterium]
MPIYDPCWSMDGACLYTRTHRTRRAAEWSAGKIVTFIVTLAATRTVTLAARAAGMSRKAAYALRQRDPAFAAAWDAAIGERRGDGAVRATSSISSTALSPSNHGLATALRPRLVPNRSQA